MFNVKTKIYKKGGGNPIGKTHGCLAINACLLISVYWFVSKEE
jgi:hypothetical protein